MGVNAFEMSGVEAKQKIVLDTFPIIPRIIWYDCNIQLENCIVQRAQLLIEAIYKLNTLMINIYLIFCETMCLI